MPLSIGIVASEYMFPTPTMTPTPTVTPTMTPTPTPTVTPTMTQLPTFSIVPDKTDINEGETVTYTINTTRFTGSTLYVSNSGTAANADLNYIFSNSVSIVGGTGTFTVSALNDTVYEGPETIIVNLRTGSTTGPIVATAPTVTINNTTPAPPVYETTSVWSGNLYSGGNKTVTGLTMDNRKHKFVLTTSQMSVAGGYTEGRVALNSVTIVSRQTSGTTTVETRVPASSTCILYLRINPGYLGNVSLSVYRQTDASFAQTGLEANPQYVLGSSLLIEPTPTPTITPSVTPPPIPVVFSATQDDNTTQTKNITLTLPSAQKLIPGHMYNINVSSITGNKLLLGDIKLNGVTQETAYPINGLNKPSSVLVFTPRSFNVTSPELSFELTFESLQPNNGVTCTMTPI